MVSLVGAALVFGGALALAPEGGGPLPAAPTPGTTAVQPSSAPLPTTVPAAPPSAPVTAASPAPSPIPGALAASGGSATPLPPPAAVTGAAPGSALQQLFATGTAASKDKALLDVGNPASPLVLVNKRNPLQPLNYVPTDLVAPELGGGNGAEVLLRSEAAAAVERMIAAAAAENVHITVKSSYRSYAKQLELYNGYVADKGVQAADSTSARAGFSEHQTGLALDIGDADAGPDCDFNSCFAGTAAGQWVAAHAADHGFVVRYQPGGETVTGYLPEPWHLRYLGAAVAQDMRARGIDSYERFAGLPGAPDYK